MRKLISLLLVLLLVPTFSLATEVYIEEYGLKFDGPDGYYYEVQHDDESLFIVLTNEVDVSRGYVLFISENEDGDSIADLDQERAQTIAGNMVDLLGLAGGLNFEAMYDEDEIVTALVMYDEENTVFALLTYAEDYMLVAIAAADEGVTREDISVLENLTMSLEFDDGVME